MKLFIFKSHTTLLPVDTLKRLINFSCVFSEKLFDFRNHAKLLQNYTVAHFTWVPSSHQGFFSYPHATWAIIAGTDERGNFQVYKVKIPCFYRPIENKKKVGIILISAG